ncbi:hypothetical protein B0O99DRAFT_636000 [Bisporella sp. PMI_857]|nr:hypothetical protein B0O99DRAFT_636000 [Bisporella sp. PMI_857]
MLLRYLSLQQVLRSNPTRAPTTMEHPVTAPWGVRITNADFEKLKGGFQPKDMEDRWACSADKPDQQGSIVVHWRRSWTGSEEIALRVNRLSDGAEIVEITWERGTGETQVSEIAGKTLATQLCQNLLGCEWAT